MSMPLCLLVFMPMSYACVYDSKTNDNNRMATPIIINVNIIHAQKTSTIHYDIICYDTM